MRRSFAQNLRMHVGDSEEGRKRKFLSRHLPKVSPKEHGRINGISRLPSLFLPAKKRLRTDGPTDIRTDGHTLLWLTTKSGFFNKQNKPGFFAYGKTRVFSLMWIPTNTHNFKNPGFFLFFFF